jgi:hydrogenase 3 maturation protease
MRTLILGVGNPLRGDDAIGSEIAKELIKLGWDNVIDAESAPENFLLKVLEKRPERVILIDACDFSGETGEFRLFKKEEWARISPASFSTHTLPLSLFMSLLEKECGCEVYLLGIQVKQLDFASEMSPDLLEAKKKIIDFLLNLLGESRTEK